MDYFDFEGAGSTCPDFDLDECSSIVAQNNEGEAQSNYESLFFDKTAELPQDPYPLPSETESAPAPWMLTLMNNVQIEVVPYQDDDNRAYPMFRAKTPCVFCQRMGMDCFLAQRGALITGCTCCISLFRECSFTHTKTPKGYVNTFPGISEDKQVCEGSTERRIAALRSFGDAFGDEYDSRPRKNGARFSRDSVKTLKQWLAAHADHPYPNDREKDELKQLTGLKRSQIANWLANARRRGKVRPSSGPCSPVVGAIDIPRRNPDPNAVDMSEMNPLDRWKLSPPENEPASVTAIARAVATAPYHQRNNSQSSLHGSRQGSRQGSRAGSSRRTSSEDDSGFSMFRAPSVSSLGTHQSSTSDLSRVSKGSHRSKGSLASSLGADRRRRRRAPMTQRAAAQNAKSRGARIFQCTFCTDTFPAKYDWQRHEKSLHLALERWTCCPAGGSYMVPATRCTHCVFCGTENPDPTHMESHNFTACTEKTPQERTFYRKDHLRQHLKLLHGTKFQPCMEGWKSQTTEVKSRCGFCPSVFNTWQARADHLAAHFKNGSDMAQWSGGWGFEPYVEHLVEDAMPPYLIAQERASMNPFIAKAAPASPNNASSSSDLTFGTSAPATIGLSSEGEGEYQIAKDSNCWSRLEQELTRYIMQSKLTGVIPSDQNLQDKSRRIIYDDDDPWNQTPADNKLWLDTLKFQTGIAEAAPAVVERLEEVPLMPPFVVRGGLRNMSAASGTVARKRSGGGSFTPDLNPGSGLSTTPLPVFDGGAMDIDFDQLDFSNLDIGLADDGFGGSIEQAGLVGGFDVNMNGLVPGFDIGKGGELMSEQDLNMLMGYTTGFH